VIPQFGDGIVDLGFEVLESPSIFKHSAARVGQHDIFRRAVQQFLAELGFEARAAPVSRPRLRLNLHFQIEPKRLPKPVETREKRCLVNVHRLQVLKERNSKLAFHHKSSDDWMSRDSGLVQHSGIAHHAYQYLVERGLVKQLAEKESLLAYHASIEL
jgi:hypothetical protein